MTHLHRIVALSCFTLAIAAISLTGCRKTLSGLSRYQPIGTAKLDTLLLFNMLPDSSFTNVPTGYLLYVNDSLVNWEGRSLGYNGGGPNNSQPCYGLPPALAISSTGGTYNLKVTNYTWGVDTPLAAHPPASRIVCQTTINLPPNSGFGDVFFYDSVPGVPRISYMPLTTADLGAPAPGAFKLRVINYAYALQDNSGYVSASLNSGGPTYNLQLQTPDSAAVKGDENISFGKVSPYVQYDYGTYQFLVYNLTTQSYISNSGPIYDVEGTFDISPNVANFLPQDQYTRWNNLYPNYFSGPASGMPSTLLYGNIGSYPFSAGGCYTVLVIGNMYAVTLDRLYDPGTLDNVGKIQLVNTAQGQTDLQVTVDAGGKTTLYNSLPYGSYTDPLVVPAGNVTCTFSSHGQTLYTYETQVPRYGYSMLCYSIDLKGVPFVFPHPVVIDNTDYVPPNYQDGTPALLELTKVSFLNLCQDGGSLFITDALPLYQNNETTASIDIPYKGSGTFLTSDGVTNVVTLLNARFSAKRPDSLANALVASLPDPIPRSPAPGCFTLVAAGLAFPAAPAEAAKLIMVRNSNYIPKAR